MTTEEKIDERYNLIVEILDLPYKIAEDVSYSRAKKIIKEEKRLVEFAEGDISIRRYFLVNIDSGDRQELVGGKDCGKQG